jgi:Uma2 family endonuclease
MRGVREFDLTRHPPPDLVIEVDITSPSIAKFPIYLAFGVPEIWHFKDERVRFFRLAQGNYVSVNESMALPSITAEAVTRFLIAATDMKRPDWLREVRQYVRSIKES